MNKHQITAAAWMLRATGADDLTSTQRLYFLTHPQPIRDIRALEAAARVRRDEIEAFLAAVEPGDTILVDGYPVEYRGLEYVGTIPAIATSEGDVSFTRVDLPFAAARAV